MDTGQRFNAAVKTVRRKDMQDTPRTEVVAGVVTVTFTQLSQVQTQFILRHFHPVHSTAAVSRNELAVPVPA
jgi:hypothetical protein